MMMKERVFLGIAVFIWLFWGLGILPAQEANRAFAGENAAVKADTADDEPLPRRFREYELGMSLDELKDALIMDDLFHFRGDRDVSFLPAREQSLVETTGSSFIRRAFFQLRDGRMFIMSFSMNPGQIDHYSVFTHFTAKYGQPEYLDPKEAVWETEDIRISIERPLTVKYIDKQVFNDIIDESTFIESRHVQMRQDFLNDF